MAFSPIKSFRHLVSSGMVIFLSACFLILVFCSGNHTAGVVAFWVDSSLEAGHLHTLAQPQIELYPVSKHGISPSNPDNSKIISGFTGVTISNLDFLRLTEY